MDETLTATLHQAAIDRLDYLDTLINEADLRFRAAPAESEIARMTAAWRALLDQRAPTSRPLPTVLRVASWLQVSPVRCGPPPISIWSLPTARTRPGAVGTRVPPDGRPSRRWASSDRVLRTQPRRTIERVVG